MMIASQLADRIELNSTLLMFYKWGLGWRRHGNLTVRV